MNHIQTTAEIHPAPPGPTGYIVDPAEIRRARQIYPGLTELRVLNAKLWGERIPGTYSGYYDDEHTDQLISDLGRVESASASYFLPNEINPALIARSYNRARLIRGREPLTGDTDIIRRKWLLIDIDSVRPAGVSATDAERDAAASMAVDIDYWLWERSFPPGIIADSGNGAHITIPIDFPADDGGFCKRMLATLAKEFDSEYAKVDVSVHNPARIWKLPGTQSRKGDNCPEIGRIWRMARIATVCQEDTEHVRS